MKRTEQYEMLLGLFWKLEFLEQAIYNRYY